MWPGGVSFSRNHPRHDVKARADLKTEILSRSRESSLRARLIARDETALVELIDLASPWLLGIAQSMLSEQEESEEVVFDSFKIAWDKVGTLPAGDEQRLIPWLCRVTRNRAIDRLRTRRRHRTKLELARAFEAPGEAAAAPAEPNEAALPGWHVHQSVHEALTALPADQLAAVRLAYFNGLSQSEIATELEIPLGTVKTRLRLGFDKLREALAPLRDWVL